MLIKNIFLIDALKIKLSGTYRYLLIIIIQRIKNIMKGEKLNCTKTICYMIYKYYIIFKYEIITHIYYNTKKLMLTYNFSIMSKLTIKKFYLLKHISNRM
jgi:hypothetical protein